MGHNVYFTTSYFIIILPAAKLMDRETSLDTLAQDTVMDSYDAIKYQGDQHQNVKLLNRTHGRWSRSSNTNSGTRQRDQDAYSHHASRNRVRDVVSHFMNNDKADLTNMDIHSLPQNSSSLSGSRHHYNQFHKKQQIDLSGICDVSNNTQSPTSSSYGSTNDSLNALSRALITKKKFIRWSLCKPETQSQDDMMRTVKAYELATLCSDWYIVLSEFAFHTEHEQDSDPQNKSTTILVFKDTQNTRQGKDNVNMILQGHVDSFFKYNDDIYFVDRRFVIPVFYRCPLGEISSTHTSVGQTNYASCLGAAKKKTSLKIIQYITSHGITEIK